MRPLLVILGCLLVVLAIDARGQMMDDFATTDEDDRVTFNVTDNDNVFLPQTNTVDLNTTLPGRQTTASTSEGDYSVNNNGEVTFNPADDFFGSSSLQYSMNYGFFGLTVGTATINVTVNSVNDHPITKDDEEVIEEDTPGTVKVLDNDTDIDDGINPASIVISDTEGGTFIPNSSGEVTFTPTPDFFGDAKAKYTVEDFAGATSNKSDIKIKVTPLNDAPVAVDDAAVTDEGVSIEIKILKNDYDIDGSIEPSSVKIIGETGGSFVVNNKGEVTFTPYAGFSEATARYTVQDDGGSPSNSATITVTINSVNDPPVATNDIVSTAEDISPPLIKVLENDTDDVGLNPASVILTNMVNGTFAANSSGQVTYTPPPNFNGIATAKYTVKDNEGAISNEATITVTVNAANDPPSFDPIADQRVLKNATNKTITITGITAGPLETEKLTFNAATSSDPGIVPAPVITYTGGSTATLTFKPNPNKSGTVTITVAITDQGLETFRRTFTIDVIEVEFTSIPITIAVTGQLYQYKIEVTPVPETLTIVATQKPAWATLTPDGPNKAKLSGTPPGNAPLTNPVTLQLKDGPTVLDQQQFTITINRPPTVSAFGINAEEDLVAEFSVDDFENAFTDPDNQSLAEVMITKLPEHGTLKLGGVAIVAGAKIPSGSISDLTYNPTPEYNGLDVASWKGSDGYSYSQNEADINFTIAPANDAPVIEFIESEDLQYELGSEVPIKLTSGILISDPDDLTLAGAEIRVDFLKSDYEPDNEQLIFKDTLNITGQFNPAAGILLLTGNSSVANYQAALRKVKYNYVNLDHVKERKTYLSITLADGKDVSTPKSRTIDLIYTFKHLDIPSAFSPNGDVVNEAWVIKSPNTTDGTVPYTEALVRVYNKRGLLVYEAKGFAKPWDGTYGGKELPVDTYYYTIDLKYNRVRYKGVVTILR